MAHDLATRLAQELTWKLEHPQQHSSTCDEVLAEFVDAADRDVERALEGVVARELHPTPPRELIDRIKALI